MKKKDHPLLDKVAEFLHRLKTKISMSFKGKNLTFTITVDLTEDIRAQLQGIEHTLISRIPTGTDLKDYLSTQKTSV
jgi:hypothetical protein